MLPLASRMPVSMASLLRSDSVNPFRNSSSYRERETNNTDLLVHVSLTFFCFTAGQFQQFTGQQLVNNLFYNLFPTL